MDLDVDINFLFPRTPATHNLPTPTLGGHFLDQDEVGDFYLSGKDDVSRNPE